MYGSMHTVQKWEVRIFVALFFSVGLVYFSLFYFLYCISQSGGNGHRDPLGYVPEVGWKVEQQGMGGLSHHHASSHRKCRSLGSWYSEASLNSASLREPTDIVFAPHPPSSSENDELTCRWQAHPPHIEDGLTLLRQRDNVERWPTNRSARKKVASGVGADWRPCYIMHHDFLWSARRQPAPDSHEADLPTDVRTGSGSKLGRKRRCWGPEGCGCRVTLKIVDSEKCNQTEQPAKLRRCRRSGQVDGIGKTARSLILHGHGCFITIRVAAPESPNYLRLLCHHLSIFPIFIMLHVFYLTWSPSHSQLFFSEFEALLFQMSFCTLK